MEKPRVQNYIPFDLYDFFGYLFPGLMVFIYVVLFEIFTFPDSQSAFTKSVDFVRDLPWFLGLFLAVASILFIYVVGHFVGALSSIGFDRILMEGIYGYPVVSLLQLTRQRRQYSEATHRYLFLAFNVFLLSAIFVAKDSHFQYVSLILGSLAAALILFRLTIKWIRVTKRGLALLRLSENHVIRALFIQPSKMLEWFEEHVLKAMVGIDQPFPAEFRAKFIDLFKKTFHMDPEGLKSENYWMSYLYVVNQNPSSAGFLKTWLHLYGFARNISTATLLCLFGFAIVRLFSEDMLNAQNKMLFGGMIVISWVFMARYWMLYQSYHTKNVLRAFVASAEIAQTAEEKERRSKRIQMRKRT